MGRWRRHAHRAAAGGLYSRDAFAAGATHRAHRGGEARPGRSGGRPSPGALWCPMSVLWSQSDARLTDAVARGGQRPPRRSPARSASRLPRLGRVEGKGPNGWRAPLHAAVLEAAAVGPATTLLDLGCGTGLFARAATDRGARVTGIDLDPAAVARATAEVPEGVFVVGDAQEPPSGPFDVVAAVQLLMHVADPTAVLSAAARTGAVVAATVWGREHECDIRLFGEALSSWLGPRPARSGPPVTDPDRLCTMAERAGLVVERLDEVVCPFEYADEDDLLGPLFESALGQAVGRRAGPVALRAAVLQRLEPYRTAAGGYRLANLFRVLVARPL